MDSKGKDSPKSNEIDDLKGEIMQLQDELLQTQRKLYETSAELNKTKEFYANNLPKLAGKAAESLEKVNELLDAISMYQHNSQRQLHDVRNKNEIAMGVAVESVDFFIGKSLELIDRAIDVCRSQDITEESKMLIGSGHDDYVFNEFKVDSRLRKITIGTKFKHIPNSEFSFLLELIKRPNEDVHFDKPELARTGIARLKQRVPELKNLIKPVFGKSSYRLTVTPITTK